jgi:hypothetical protein
MQIKFPLLFLFVGFIASNCLAQKDSSQSKKHVPQYNKKVTFDISPEPNAFFDARGKTFVSAYNIDNYGASRKESFSTHKQEYGGMDLAIGVAIKKQFHVDLLGGFSVNGNMGWIPAGADFKFNILNKKVSPYIHFGGGYMYTLFYPQLDNIVLLRDNGAFALSGIGVSIKASKAMCIAISADYRFVYNDCKYRPGMWFDVNDFDGPPTYVEKTFLHQLGLRLSLIFY